MSCAVAPGSPVFSPSRLGLLTPLEQLHHHHHHGCSSSGASFPGSPLRPFALLRARIVHHEPSSCAAQQPPAAKAADPSSVAAVPAKDPVKRRRPAPLLVPAAVTVAPAVLEAAAASGVDEVTEQGEGFAAFCRRGKGRKRFEMEDRHVAAVALGGDRAQALFGVFDGHGGKLAAEFAADNMPRIVAEELERSARGGGAGRAAVEGAVRRAYLRTDEEFSSSSKNREQAGGGACCVTALLRDGGRQLVVSGAGDCRAVLSRGGRAEALTDDHRASRQDERDRIEALKGGLVLNCRGTWRVQGSLAVTRGIGDAHLKPWVVAEPETRTVDVGADCELLILASDGLWDKVGNQEAVDAARVSASSSSSGDLPAACRRLVDMAVSRGSSDDISVLVVQLQRPLR